MQVELVSTTTSDNLRLDGVLHQPPAHAWPSLGVDAALCLHGVHSNFYTPLFYDGLAEYLKPAGCAVLRVNTRGHDDIYTTAGRRLGAAYETVDDCKLDIAAWLAFLAERGMQRVLLWGHSLGAVKTVYYMADQPDARIIAAIASSPPRFNYANQLAEANATRFTDVMEQANRLIAAGNPDGLVESQAPVVSHFGAAAYADKYGPADRYDYMRYLPAIKTPLLITVGGLESGLYYRDINARGPSIKSDLPMVSYQSIEGANHVYRDRVLMLWQTAQTWLAGVLPPT